MAKQTGLLLLALGGAALLMGGKKKRKKGIERKPGAEVEIFGQGTESDQGGFIPTDRPGEAPAGGGMETMAFDETCTKVLDTQGTAIDPKHIYRVENGQYVALNPLKFNNFITGKFYEGRNQGVEGADDMASFVIMAQPGLAHCPWSEPEKWTDLMRMTYEDLRHGIDEFAIQQGEWIKE